MIASLDPASGAAGQQIVVVGADFLSPGGEIVATFNGQPTATSCPTQGECTVVVPPASRSVAQVQITTSTATSNAVNFAYGAAPTPLTGAGPTLPVAGTASCATPGALCPVPNGARRSGAKGARG